MSCEALVGEGRSRTCENEGQCCMCICMLSTSELLQESVAIYMFEIVCIACNACSNYIILLCDAHGYPIHWRNVLIYGLSRKHAAPTYLSFCCHLYGCACNVCPCIHMCLWVSAYACIESEHTLHCVLFWIPSHRARHIHTTAYHTRVHFWMMLHRESDNVWCNACIIYCMYSYARI